MTSGAVALPSVSVIPSGKALDADAERVTAPGAELIARRTAEILRNPTNNAALSRAMEEVAPGDPAAGLAWARGLQAGRAEPLASVLAAFAKAHGDASVRDVFAQELAAAEARVLAPFARAWDAVLRGLPVADADAEAVLADGAALGQVYFRFVHPVPLQLPLLGGKPADAKAIAAAGFAQSSLSAFLDGFLTTEAQWRDVLTASRMPSEAARARVFGKEAECGWIDRTLAAGELTFMDPRSGEICRAVDGMIAFGRCIYRFEGEEPFFLLTGGPWNAPQGLYLPRSATVLSFGGEWTSRLRGEMLANMLALYLQRRVRPALRPAGSPPAMTILVPPVDNFAHHIWNYLTGLERARRLGVLERAATVQFSGTEFFGPIEALFPELDGGRLAHPARDPIVDPAPLDPRSLVLPAAGFFLPRSLTDRITQVLRARPRGRPDAVEPDDVPRLAGAPLIWLGLRVRGRAWAGQEEGFVHIMRRISERHPDALFLLDGFSYPVGADHVSHKWEGAIGALREMAARVRAAAPDPSRVINMVGNTMRESVLWAAETTAYLCPYGTTQHKVAWFSDAPGIVYAPPGVKAAQVYGTAGFAAAEIAALPEFVVGAAVESESVKVGPRRAVTAYNVDVTLDAEEMAQRLLAMLAARLAPVTPMPFQAAERPSSRLKEPHMTMPGARVQPNHSTTKNRHPRVFTMAAEYMKGQGIIAPRVLSYGCSTGEEPATLSELYFPDSDVVGVDILPDLVDTARKAFSVSHPRVTFDLSTPEVIAQHGPFDVIFAMSVLCRIDCKTFEALSKVFTLQDFAAHIALLDSVLKPGGLMVVLNGNYSVLDTPSAAHFTVVGAEVGKLGQFMPVYRPDGSAAAPPHSTAVLFAKIAD